MIISEDELIRCLKKSKKAVLLEPRYRRKYPPLGLAKIASFIRGNGGEVVFQREYAPCGEDLVCVTSLFTYDSEKVLGELSKITAADPAANILVGGVYASLMPEHILGRFPNVKLFVGYSKTLDMTKPDYSIDWGVEEPWGSFSYVFTSRGCPNKCAYCAVWRLEPEMWVNPKWREVIDETKPNVMVSDNNLSAQPREHLKAVCEFLKERGKGVVFDNGFDCKRIDKGVAGMLAELKIVRRPQGMRLAFDRIEEDGTFQRAVGMLLDAGISRDKMTAYVLFNFTDTPEEAIYRAEECVRLGIRPYPQMFTPLNSTSRKGKFIGKHWTELLTTVYRWFFLMAGRHARYSFREWARTQEWRRHVPSSLLKDHKFTDKEKELLGLA